MCLGHEVELGYHNFDHKTVGLNRNRVAAMTPARNRRSEERMKVETDPLSDIEVIEARARGDLLLICDHASNHIPDRFKGLGLPPEQLGRHIAWDIGAAPVTRRLAALFGAKAILSQFSRLVIDPNRALDDPTLIMKLSDGAIIPGNRDLSENERQDRIDQFYVPYDDAIDRSADHVVAHHESPKIVSIHSFTHSWRGIVRPQHIGLLWDQDDRLFRRLQDALTRHPGVVVGDNQPYSGRLEGDCMYRHGTSRGIAHVLIEIRQDLISDEAGVEKWSNLLFDALKRALDDAPEGYYNVITPPT